MASLQLDPLSGRYRIRFYFLGREYKRSLHTKQRRIAMVSLGQVEETLRLIESGMAEVPSNVEPGAYIVSGARLRQEQRPQSPVRTVADLFVIYQQELPAGAKEEQTLRGERIHFKHLLRHLKPRTLVANLDAATLQRYVQLRSKEKHNGRFVGPNTIKKEITTFRLVWNRAKKKRYLATPPPVEGIVYAKRDEKPPFMTLAEVQQALGRPDISDHEISELWESVYLNGSDLDALLTHVNRKSNDPFVYPMFVLGIHTGMRRSELLRLQVGDLDFENRTVAVREKKRSRKHALSYRRIPMSNLVAEVCKPFVSGRPSHDFALVRPNGQPVTTDIATHVFKKALKNSTWEKLRGYHTFRHSFASNAAVEGVDQRMIDEWMGHQTEEMRKRYRHLAPSRQQAAMDSLFTHRSSAS